MPYVIGVDLVEAIKNRVWPAGWRKPTDEMIAVIEQAAQQFDVPVELLYSVIRKESNFNPKAKGYKHGGNSPTYAKSYEKYKNLTIPNSGGMTWGQMFKLEDWRPYGLCQLNAYHLVGTTGGVKAGPISNLFSVVPNVRRAAALLASLKQKRESWDDVLQAYNGSSAYRKEVAGFIVAFKEANAQVA